MKPLLLAFLLLYSSVAFSQVTFEKGYLINNTNDTIHCLIKNVDWNSNPRSIEYKLKDDAEKLTAGVNDIRQFEIYSSTRYISRLVKIDRSSSSLRNLSSAKEPEFVEEHLFLRQLVSGRANLYSYVKNQFVRFFYQLENDSVQQLVYKMYEVESNVVNYNEGYKKQLASFQSCASISVQDLNALQYTEKKLINIFLKYNRCGGENEVATSYQSRKFEFHLNIRPRLNYASYEIWRVDGKPTMELDRRSTVGAGLEVEYVLPVNKNKWSIIFEPTFITYKNTKTFDAYYVNGGKLNVRVDYKAVELPLGVRYYMFLNKNSKVFINAQYVFDYTLSSSVFLDRFDHSNYETFKIKTDQNFAAGIGYSLLNKYGIEFRYFTRKDLVSDYVDYKSNFQNMSFIFSYKLF